MSEQVETCEWKEDCDSVWDTSCGYVFGILDGGPPSESGFNFCIFCGKPLEEVPYVSPSDEE